MADELPYIIGSDGKTKVFDEYHLCLHDYHEEDRACGRAFLLGERACDVSAYGWFGVELNYMVPKGEEETWNAGSQPGDWTWTPTYEEMLQKPWMLVLDPVSLKGYDADGFAWQDGHSYRFSYTYDEAERDYHIDFVRIS